MPASYPLSKSQDFHQQFIAMKKLLAAVLSVIHAICEKSASRRGRFQQVNLLPQPAVVSRHTARMPGSTRRVRVHGER
jgi:hypothetical protein